MFNRLRAAYRAARTAPSKTPERQINVTTTPVSIRDRSGVGINLIRVVEDHGHATLKEIDDEIFDHMEKIESLQQKRVAVLQLVKVIDPTIK